MEAKRRISREFFGGVTTSNGDHNLDRGPAEKVHARMAVKIKKKRKKSDDGSADAAGAAGEWISCERAARTEASEVAEELNTDLANGLSVTEADRRRGEHGLNEIAGKGPDPMWKKYLEQFWNPFILLLLISVIISAAMSQVDDAVSITVAILIVVTVGFVQEYRSERTLEKMESLLPPNCTVEREGEPGVVFAKYLVPGDIVHLSMGDRVPADLRLFQANQVSVDESSLTGESDPIAKDDAKIASSSEKSLDVSSMRNICFQGTLVVAGRGKGIVLCTGDRSKMGELFRLMREEEPPKTPLQKSMDTLGKQLSAVSLAVIALIMAVGCLQGRPVLHMFNVGVSLAVAAIPEGLPIVVTVTLAFGVMRMAKRNAVVRKLPTVEALGCADVICSDKTGTLTTNNMTVSHVLTPTFIFTEGDGDKGCPDFDLDRDMIGGDAETLSALEVGVLCNNASLGLDGREAMGSPTERAILEAVHKLEMLNDFLGPYTRLSETPFQHVTKIMSVECRRNDGKVFHFAKGATEVLLRKCKTVTVGGKRVPLDDEDQFDRIMNVMHRLCAVGGRRCLGVAKGADMDSLEFMGVIAMVDPPRPGVADSISVLQNSKVRVVMITGDAEATAASVSRVLGIRSEGMKMLSGNDLEEMSEDKLKGMVDSIYCFFRASPKHKVRIVSALQANGHVVGMTGDGVNDSVAVKRADVGICMGVTGTDVCKEAADMVLLDDDFSTILSAIEEGKSIFYNIQNFVRFQLSTSISALMLIALSTLADIPNPLNPMQILWINILMDGPPAQSLGLEPVDPEVLRRPPRSVRDQILSKKLIVNVLLSAAIIISGTMLVLYMLLEDGKMTPRDHTMTFTAFVFFDMFNALTSRSQHRLIALEVGFFSNKAFTVSVLLSILGQLAVIYLPPLQYVFQTESLALPDIAILIAISSSVFFICETKKLIERFTCCGGKFFFNLNSRPTKGLGQNGNYNKYDSA